MVNVPVYTFDPRKLLHTSNSIVLRLVRKTLLLNVILFLTDL